MLKYFIIIGLLGCISVNAQVVNKPVQISHYIFESFTKGKVRVKSGIISEQLLNYNSITGEMIFDDNGKLLAIGNPEEVDTVFMRDRKFIPVKNKFYEVLTNTKAPLLLEFTCTIEEPSVSTGYGTSTPTTNAGSVKFLPGMAKAYEMKLPDDYKVTPVYTYWIYKDEEFQKVNTSKQLIQLFPDKKDFIKNYVKKNNVSFSKREGIITLVRQVEQ